MLRLRALARRLKLWTTIARETAGYLRGLVAAGKARSMAEALDVAVARLRRAERRARLERDTAAYFKGLGPTAAGAEARLASALGEAVDEVDLEA